MSEIVKPDFFVNRIGKISAPFVAVAGTNASSQGSGEILAAN